MNTTPADQFARDYASLNDAQRAAVDTIEGPVMVIAGPGTGKTQLLSMRVANILRLTDAAADNILCLTFTESGAAAMRQRLVGMIGSDAYGVAIHTFHSFGSEVINTYSDFFYHGARFKPADELSSYEIIRTLFEALPHTNPLASMMNGEYTHLRDTQKAISDLKKSGLSPDELLAVIDHNDAFIEYAAPLVQDAFDGGRLSKKSFGLVATNLEKLQSYQDSDMPALGYRPLAQLFTHSLEAALHQSLADDSTKPLSAWKKQWCEKNDKGQTVIKEARQSRKMRALSGLYRDYLLAMENAALFDFDDMILRVIRALDQTPELTFNLQERYQYILVDEFQDTNGAQMRLLHGLADNPVNEGRPNLLVVGDDDQAIYRFQGAEIGNIINFSQLYRDPALITLRDNYRSDAAVLTAARGIIMQAEERLESTIESVDKTLTPHYEPAHAARVEMHHLKSHTSELSFVADHVSRLIASGTKPSDIAVIGRNHTQLQTVLPYLTASGIPLSYERQDDILSDPAIEATLAIARLVVAVAEQRFADANAMMPQLLAHPMWNIDPITLWRLGLEASNQRRQWLDIMLGYSDATSLPAIAGWLIGCSQAAVHQPLEVVLDTIIGSPPQTMPDDASADIGSGADQLDDHGIYRSPLQSYYFSDERLESQPSAYMTHLMALVTIRRRIRDYHPDHRLLLADFLSYVDTYQRLGIRIPMSDEYRPATECVSVMTAHKSKGLEYDSVYIIGLSDTLWGGKSRGRGSGISFPHNLPLSAGGDTDDERLRLLFVAMTRAKSNLIMSYADTDAAGKPVEPARYIITAPPANVTDHNDSGLSAHDEMQALTSSWHDRYLSIDGSSLHDLIAPRLETYKLSSTHLSNFLDVTRGGPRDFLLQNILRFPSVMSPQAAFGTAIHNTLAQAHGHLRATGNRRPLEDVLSDFETSLEDMQLPVRDHEFWSAKGADVLQAYLQARYDSFTRDQIVERHFSRQDIRIGQARVGGAIDLMDINQQAKVITLTDYKTGKAQPDWRGDTDVHKIKLHRYKQQLMFYKLLVEGSRDFGGKGFSVDLGVIEFVEPDSNGDVHRLELIYEQSELDTFKRLIQAVWHCIMTFDFPDTSSYDTRLSGIKAFEADLLEKYADQ